MRYQLVNFVRFSTDDHTPNGTPALYNIASSSCSLGWQYVLALF